MTERVDVDVLPHSTEDAPLEATENTLKALPGAGCVGFERDESGAVIVRDGWVRAICLNPGFLMFAIERQGYARQAKMVR